MSSSSSTNSNSSYPISPPSRSVSPPPPFSVASPSNGGGGGRVEARDRTEVYVIPWQTNGQTFHVNKFWGVSGKEQGGGGGPGKSLAPSMDGDDGEERDDGEQRD